MCEACWDEYGEPNIVNEKTQAALMLVMQVYDAIGGGAGGNLHIVLDDWNIEDDSIYYCLSQCEVVEHSFGGGFDTTPTLLERACGGAFLDMTLQERASVLAKFGRMFGTDGEQETT